MNIANAIDHNWNDQLFEVWFSISPYSPPIRVYVWGSDLGSAFEEACDWAYDTGNHGVFTLLTVESFEEAATDLGLLDDYRADMEVNAQTETCEKVWEHAEMDLTTIGHTTYPDLDGMPYVESWNWGGRDVYGDDYAAVKAASVALDDDAS